MPPSMIDRLNEYDRFSPHSNEVGRFLVDVLKAPNGPPPIPPPKNRLNISSGEISDSHIGPGWVEPGLLGKPARPLKGDKADADPGPNR